MSARETVLVIAASNPIRAKLFRRTYANRPPAQTMHTWRKSRPG